LYEKIWYRRQTFGFIEEMKQSETQNSKTPQC